MRNTVLFSSLRNISARSPKTLSHQICLGVAAPATLVHFFRGLGVLGEVCLEGLPYFLQGLHSGHFSSDAECSSFELRRSIVLGLKGHMLKATNSK